MEERQDLTFAYRGGPDWYRARCPELDVYGQGRSALDAVASSLKCVLMTSQYIVNEGIEDQRTPFARAVVDGEVGNIHIISA